MTEMTALKYLSQSRLYIELQFSPCSENEFFIA